MMLLISLLATVWLISAYEQGAIGFWAILMSYLILSIPMVLMKISENIKNAKKEVSAVRAHRHETNKKIA